jgi:hypothetical protein
VKVLKLITKTKANIGLGPYSCPRIVPETDKTSEGEKMNEHQRFVDHQEQLCLDSCAPRAVLTPDVTPGLQILGGWSLIRPFFTKVMAQFLLSHILL